MDLRTRIETRGFLKDYSSEELFKLYEQWGQTLYVWFDPTADSLHLWNFVQFMHALQYGLYWNKIILLVWWATGMIGDPGGKNTERTFLNKETLAHNVASLTKQVDLLINRLRETTWKDLEYEVVNNNEFYKNLWYTEFLRTVGKYITVNQMMKKETVKHRLTDEDKFISYTEFSYMLMQGYDYLQLFKQKDCRLQLWASDQRGNIVTWVELIRKIADGESYAVTCPLLTDSTGRKFGKSEGNAIWLDPKKNSPYICYNYFMNSGDDDISRYLLTFTLLTNEKVKEIVDTHADAPEKRIGQERLAYEVTSMVFGNEQADYCRKIKATLFGREDSIEVIKTLSDKEIIALNKATGAATITTPEQKLIDLLVLSWLYASNGEAKKAIKGQAVSLNEQKISDIWYILSEQDYNNSVALLRKWKKNYATILLNR